MISASVFACAAVYSPGWSERGVLSLSIGKAEAAARVYIRTVYYTAADLPWYAVRAFYFGGPWSGAGYSYTGWDDYASRNGIGCRPGTAVKGGDGIMYNCQ